MSKSTKYPLIFQPKDGASDVKLLFNAGIAALIFPIHSLFETKLKARIVEKRIITIIIALLFSGAVKGIDDNFSDSLAQVIETWEMRRDQQGGDSSICYAFILLGEEVYLGYPDSALHLFYRARDCAMTGLEQAENEKEKDRYLYLVAEALNDMAFMVVAVGRIEEALIFNHQSLEMNQRLANSANEAVALKGESAVATSLNNIGIIHDDQGDLSKGLKFHQKSLKIRLGINDQYGIAESLNNIGYIMSERGMLSDAKEYYERSLKIYTELDYLAGMSTALNNIGNVLVERSDYKAAIVYFEKSLKMHEEIGDYGGMALDLNNLSAIYLYQKKFTKAKNLAFRSMALAEELGYPERIRNAAHRLYQIYIEDKNYEQALESFELYVQMRDSLKNEKTQKAAIRQVTKYEFEKAQLVKEQAEKEAVRILAEETARRDNLQYSIITLTLLIMFLGIVVTPRLRGVLFAISPRLLEGSIFFTFLILFEFILVLADPYIDDWSAGAPGIKLLFNAGIAALIFPLHAFFEDKLKRRLVKD